MPGRPNRRRGRAQIACLALGLALPGLAWSQTAPARDPQAVERRFQEILFSLFVLTNNAFTAGGEARFDDNSTVSKFNVFGLPLQRRFEETPVGPLELRVLFSYGDATTTTLGNFGGLGTDTLAYQRSFIQTNDLRIQLGRPIALLPNLEFLPLLGLGYSHWRGKSTFTSASGSPLAARVDFGVDSLIYEAIGILEYRHEWRGLEIRPGIAVNFSAIDSLDGRAWAPAQLGEPARRSRAYLSGQSTVLRAGGSVEGPLPVTLGSVGLRWQAFAVASYETSNHALFPWSVEVGAAAGVDLSRQGRALTGLDIGTLFVGASYIVGENLQGARLNFGFRF